MLVAAWLRIIQLRYSLSLLIFLRESVNSLLSSLVEMKGGFDRVSSVDSIRIEYGLFFSGTCLSKPYQLTPPHHTYYSTQRTWALLALAASRAPSALAFLPPPYLSPCHVSAARYRICSRRDVGSRKSSRLWNLVKVISHSKAYINVGAGTWKCLSTAYTRWIGTDSWSLLLSTIMDC